MRQECEKYVFIETFGCQMNENDTERMFAFLKQLHYRPTDTPERADLILINTCRTRQNRRYTALREGIRNLRRKNPSFL